MRLGRKSNSRVNDIVKLYVKRTVYHGEQKDMDDMDINNFILFGINSDSIF